MTIRLPRRKSRPGSTFFSSATASAPPCLATPARGRSPSPKYAITPARSAAALVASLADAMQFAHHQGVLHRDLKPSNVLLELDAAKHPSAGDYLACCTPKLIDFGLATLDEGARPDANLH